MSSSPLTSPDRPDKVVSVRLTEPEHKLLRMVSASQGLSMASYVEEALKARMQREVVEMQREVVEMSSEFARLAERLRLSDDLTDERMSARKGVN